MFSDVLQQLMNAVPGARSCTVMGFDGIAITSKEALTADGTEKDAAVEVAAVTSQLKRAAESIGAGEVKEITLETEGLTTVLRPLTHEYCLALTLGPEGLTGKARYLMRVLAPGIAAELV